MTRSQDIANALNTLAIFGMFLGPMFMFNVGGLFEERYLRYLAGALVLAIAWTLARCNDSCKLWGNIGITFFGAVQTTYGTIVTRWFSFVGLPLVPVRSYYLLSQGPRQQLAGGSMTEYQVARVPGRVGLWWPSIAKTLGKTLIALVILAVVGTAFVYFGQKYRFIR